MAADLFPRVQTERRAPEPWVDITRAAEHMGVSHRWLYANGDRLGIPCARVGRQRRYLLSTLTTYMLSTMEPAA